MKLKNYEAKLSKNNSPEKFEKLEKVDKLERMDDMRGRDIDSPTRKVEK